MENSKQLHEHYVRDLTLKETFDGKEYRRTKNVDWWKRIAPHSSNGQFVDIGREIDGGRQCWFWSDQHFGHKNIIKYSNRPFQSTDEMTSAMIKNYMTTVSENDIVVFGGDLAFMPNTITNPIIDKLPGYKILIVGNHDLRKDGSIVEYNFDEIHPCVSFYVAGQWPAKLLLTHYPLINLPEHCYNIHGHIHTQDSPTERHFNISVEKTNYGLVSFEHILTALKIRQGLYSKP